MTESAAQNSFARNEGGKDNYAEVRGLKMYYEIHGEGFPPPSPTEKMFEIGKPLT